MRTALKRLEQRHGLPLLIQRTRRTVLASYGCLIALLVGGGLLLHTQSAGGLLPVLLRLLPLVLFLPTLLTHRPRSHLWLAFVSLLYLIQGGMIATLPGRLGLGLLEALASLALGLSSLLYAYWRNRQLTS